MLKGQAPVVFYTAICGKKTADEVSTGTGARGFGLVRRLIHWWYLWVWLLN